MSDDPYAGWNAWLQAGIAAAIAEERKLQREVHAEVIAHLQGLFDAELKDLRIELEAKITMQAAELAAEHAMRAAELNVAVLGVKTDLCKRMEATIVEMRRVLAAGDARAADTGLKTLN